MTSTELTTVSDAVTTIISSASNKLQQNSKLDDLDAIAAYSTVGAQISKDANTLRRLIGKLDEMVAKCDKEKKAAADRIQAKIAGHGFSLVVPNANPPVSSPNHKSASAAWVAESKPHRTITSHKPHNVTKSYSRAAAPHTTPTTQPSIHLKAAVSSHHAVHLQLANPSSKVSFSQLELDGLAPIRIATVNHQGEIPEWSIRRVMSSGLTIMKLNGMYFELGHCLFSHDNGSASTARVCNNTNPKHMQTCRSYHIPVSGIPTPKMMIGTKHIDYMVDKTLTDTNSFRSTTQMDKTLLHDMLHIMSNVIGVGIHRLALLHDLHKNNKCLDKPTGVACHPNRSTRRKMRYRSKHVS